MDQPAPFIIQPTSEHTHTIILLHGLGSSGDRFGSALMQYDGLSSLSKHFPGMKYIFPTATGNRSAALERLKIRQWFNIASLKDTSYRSDLQLDGLQQSAKLIRSIIRSEIETHAIPPGNICLGGLSQGYAMSITILLGLEFPLGGFVGMSGWLPFRKEVDALVKENKNCTSGGKEDGKEMMMMMMMMLQLNFANQATTRIITIMTVIKMIPSFSLFHT